jgi:hypothetical protein
MNWFFYFGSIAVMALVIIGAARLMRSANRGVIMLGFIDPDDMPTPDVFGNKCTCGGLTVSVSGTTGITLLGQCPSCGRWIETVG